MQGRTCETNALEKLSLQFGVSCESWFCANAAHCEEEGEEGEENEKGWLAYTRAACFGVR